MWARLEELIARGRSRPAARAASPALLDAFAAHYEGLLEELTALSGSSAAAEAAIDEAFRRAALDPVGFEQIGRQREWLLAIARNHIVRRPFRRKDLDAAQNAAPRFERPTLEATLWNLESTNGWIGVKEDWEVLEDGRTSQTVVIQQPDGSFASVWLILPLDLFGVSPALVASMQPGCAAVVEVSGATRDASYTVVSPDGGRTLQVRSTVSGLADSWLSWRAWSVVESPAISVSRLRPVG